MLAGVSCQKFRIEIANWGNRTTPGDAYAKLTDTITHEVQRVDVGSEEGFTFMTFSPEKCKLTTNFTSYVNPANGRNWNEMVDDLRAFQHAFYSRVDHKDILFSMCTGNGDANFHYCPTLMVFSLGGSVWYSIFADQYTTPVQRWFAEFEGGYCYG